MNYSKSLFLLTLFMGSLISISSSSWLGAWMGLEINLLSFIPLMSDDSLMSNEASLKYFLTQAVASIILLLGIIMCSYIMNPDNTTRFFSFMSMPLLMKMGAAPFHFWFPNMIEGMSWVNAILLMTWQKLPSLVLISYISTSPIITVSIFTSMIIGSIGGLNQTSMRKMLAFSSINHMSWILSALLFSDNLWFTYFLFYCFISISVMSILNICNISHINQLYSLFVNNPVLKTTFALNLLSMGGLPPFLGFLPKWMVIQPLIESNQMFLMTALIISTLIALFFYLRICFSSILILSFEPKWNMKFIDYKTWVMTLFSMISVVGFPSISLLFYML